MKDGIIITNNFHQLKHFLRASCVPGTTLKDQRGRHASDTALALQGDRCRHTCKNCAWKGFDTGLNTLLNTHTHTHTKEGAASSAYGDQGRAQKRGQSFLQGLRRTRRSLPGRKQAEEYPSHQESTLSPSRHVLATRPLSHMRQAIQGHRGQRPAGHSSVTTRGPPESTG